MSVTVHRQEVLLKDLPTHAVTFYPNQALVKRTVPNVHLKPGSNEVEIYGLTPTIDESSVKVDGVGSATVTDMTVDLVQNKEAFEQAYPDEMTLDLSDSEDETDEDESESEHGKTLSEDMDGLKEEIEREQKKYNAITARLDFLTSWYQKVDASKIETMKIAERLDLFQRQSVSMNDELLDSREKGKALEAKLATKKKEWEKATQQSRRTKRRATLEKAAKRKEKELSKEAGRKEKRRIRDERLKYWPKKVYKLTIYLEVPAETPASSRRSSVTEATLSGPEPKSQVDEQDESLMPTNLMISYITTEASWAPRYDIDLSTGSKGGKITYRAEFSNQTSETWQDAKIWLSTSQASFRGLDDAVPWMQPWHIGLTRGGGGSGLGLTSLQESSSMVNGQVKGQMAPVSNRAGLFGIDNNSFANTRITLDSHAAHDNNRDRRGPIAITHHTQNQKGGLFGSSSLFQAAGGFGSSSVAPAPQSTSGAQNPHRYEAEHHLPTGHGASLRKRSQARHDKETHHAEVEEDLEEYRQFDGDGRLDSTIDFEDTNKEDHGLTTTYELPGSRTLAPSSLTRRHKIATLPFANLIMTSISVPKLRAAAFLRARFRNPSSSVTLLKGTAGLNLDGTFLGNTSLPRTSPGQLITLALGVDPAVQVSYAKPTVKRSTQGIFNKEASQIFTRSIIVTNTKPIAAELIVLDQIPISEDEKLRVDIFEPKGLAKEGDQMRVGVNAKEGKDKGLKWGRATATILKNGEIKFDVNLDPKAACRLAVEYECKAPNSETILSK